MAEVARRAGVSVSTVSHVLNDTRVVSARTRDAVQAAIRETGYVPNTVARSLVTARTQSLGLAISAISNSYFGDVVQSIEAECERQGYTLLLAETHDDPAWEERVVRDLHERRVDGILLAPSAEPDRALGYLRDRGVSVVLLDRMVDAELDRIGTENIEPTAALVGHLADLGHTRIGMVSGLRGLTTTEERVAGFLLGLRRAGLPAGAGAIASGGSDADPARHAVEELLALPAPPTALVVGNNHMTIGAMRALRAAGLAVPRDVALVAFDDFEWADLFAPRLTTIAQPTRELGTQAVQLLLTRLQDPGLPARAVRLTPAFVHRDSCGCDPAGEAGNGGPQSRPLPARRSR